MDLIVVLILTSITAFVGLILHPDTYIQNNPELFSITGEHLKLTPLKIAHAFRLSSKFCTPHFDVEGCRCCCENVAVSLLLLLLAGIDCDIS
ncbi:hypothetical protein DERP_011214 [Dermatophagoides pteronyssinus]|uniref:Uncharacterized protein n=1 Tax=Dermatophagoides pteronyssinus TaxID=6956 RepID=A0ABQ8JCL8_DERPT|nr:hypothetical protein DERP_011214 [Dermatophagoides pteronyssinus]